jgi:hypothetical protein
MHCLIMKTNTRNFFSPATENLLCCFMLLWGQFGLIFFLSPYSFIIYFSFSFQILFYGMYGRLLSVILCIKTEGFQKEIQVHLQC